MAELKTKVNERSVEQFISGITDDQKRQDCATLIEMMRQATGAEPKMWGDNLIGFGSYQYRYASGREGDWFLSGFSPRKQNLSIYILAGFEQYPELMQNLGKYTTGKSCLYIKRLSAIQLPVLSQLIERSVRHMVESNPPS